MCCIKTLCLPMCLQLLGPNVQPGLELLVRSGVHCPIQSRSQTDFQLLHVFPQYAYELELVARYPEPITPQYIISVKSNHASVCKIWVFL